MKPIHKTLVVLSPGFPASESDSTCLPAQQAFIKSLNTQYKKLRIIIVAFQYPFVSTPYFWHGNLVIPLNGRNKGKINRILTWRKAWKTLKKLHAENDITGILNFWCTECALVGHRFGEKEKIRYFTWILGQDARKKNKFIYWIKPQAENLIAMSEFLAQEFYRNHGIRPAHIIPNGVDIKLFPAAKEKREIDLLGAGSLISLKRYDLFIRIAKKMQAGRPDLNCLICGQGPEEEKLRKMILDEDLQNNISLAGERNHAELLHWMSRSKVLLHPSDYEGFSTVCLEALYAGAHVVSFCDPGIGKIAHWHIVKDEKEMARVACKIIAGVHTDYGPVLVYSMDDNAKKLMLLFHFDGG